MRELLQRSRFHSPLAQLTKKQRYTKRAVIGVGLFQHFESSKWGGSSARVHLGRSIPREFKTKLRYI